MNAIVMNYPERTFSVSSAFMKKANIYGTPEYYQLQEVRNAHPGFEQITREFKKNTKQEHYNGLTYDYMRTFIHKYEDKEHIKSVLAELEKQIDMSRCHSKGKRYPEVKSWFLTRYPDLYTFGKSDEDIALDVARAKAKKAEAMLKLQEANAEADELEAAVKVLTVNNITKLDSAVNQ